MSLFNTMINLQLQIFTLVAVGYYIGRKNIMSSKCRQCLTDIFIQFILPCNIISSFEIKFTHDVAKNMFGIIAISFAIQFLCLFLSKILYPSTEERQKKVLQYATIVSNAGFMGNPIVAGVYGANGLLYASIALIPLRIFMWSAGLSLFTSTDKNKVVRQLLTHPCIIAVEIGMVLMIGQIKLPIFLNNAILGLGNCVTPISMIIIGSILAEVKLASVINRKTIYYTGIRLIAIPFFILITLRFFHVDPLLIGVSVLLAGMPAGSTTAILAEKYNGDAKFASKCIFVSTILSLMTLPVFCMVLEKF